MACSIQALSCYLKLEDGGKARQEAIVPQNLPSLLNKRNRYKSSATCSLAGLTGNTEHETV